MGIPGSIGRVMASGSMISVKQLDPRSLMSHGLNVLRKAISPERISRWCSSDNDQVQPRGPGQKVRVKYEQQHTSCQCDMEVYFWRPEE